MNKEKIDFTTRSLIAPVNIEARKDFLLKNSQEFQIPVTGKYRGTEKQNIALLKFLKENPAFRKKWETALLKASESKKRERDSVVNVAKKSTRDIQHEYGQKIYVKDASVYNEKEAGGNKNAIGETLHYSDDPEIPTSCAANWWKFPLWTILRINGKKYIVDDYGGFVNEHPNRIDRYLPHAIYKSQLVDHPRVEVIKWWDFNRAEAILKTRKPEKNPHVSMMLKEIRSRVEPI